MSKKITDLPVATSLADADPLLATDLSSGLSVQVDAANVGGNVGNSGRSVFWSDCEPGDVVGFDLFSSNTGSGNIAALGAGDADADGGLGVLELDTGGVAGAAILTVGKPPAFPFRGALTRVVEARVKLPNTPSDITFAVGLDDFQVGSSAFFGYTETVGTWELFCQSVAGADSALDATAVAAVAGWNTIRIEIDPGVECRAYVNGALVATITNPDEDAVPQGSDAMTLIVRAEKGGFPDVQAHLDWVRVVGDRA